MEANCDFFATPPSVSIPIFCILLEEEEENGTVICAHGKKERKDGGEIEIHGPAKNG